MAPADTATEFVIHPATFDAATSRACFSYELGDYTFTEYLQFPSGAEVADGAAFEKLLGLAAVVLGVSYFKLLAPLIISAPQLLLTPAEQEFAVDLYENGLGEFYARNGLNRFGRLSFRSGVDTSSGPAAPTLRKRTLLPIGGGKDSLVSVRLLEEAQVEFTPFAVNPKGPILSSVGQIGRAPLYVSRTLDPEMIRLSKEPGYLTGHVPSTAINSMVAALAALLFSYDRIALSNERSASEGNAQHDGREVNHQYSKSLAFEEKLAAVLAAATGGALSYFSLLRPYSEARIAAMFGQDTRFDRVFSSCNRNFKYAGHDGPLWCGECPKCHFTFLILAPAMNKDRLLAIFGQNLLARPENERSFRELTGLAGQKPWECVGEILEASACLYTLTTDKHWADDAVVSSLKADLLNQYGSGRLEAALEVLMVDSPQHHLPPELAKRVVEHAF